MADVGKLERLLNLVSFLLASKAPIPFSAIRGHVIGYDDAASADAIEKRFERDKRELRLLSIHAEYVDDRQGQCGYIVRKDALLQREMEFTQEDAAVLSMAARVGEVATGGGLLGEALKSALRKLSVDLPDGDLGAELGALTTLRAQSGDPAGQEVLAVLANAVAGSRRVRFVYSSLSSPTALREIEPYGVGMVRGAWYVVGLCKGKKEVRTFKLGRIQGGVQTCSQRDAADFDVPAAFSLAQHLHNEGWQIGERKPVTVVLRVPEGKATPILPPRATRVGCDTNGVRYELSVRSPEQLVPWLLARGGDVVVDSPASLRQAVKTATEKLLRCHATKEVPSEQTSRAASAG